MAIVDKKAKYDDAKKTIYIDTPKFNELTSSLPKPSFCKISVTFDGNYYTDYNEDFLIYSNSNRKPISLTPKCGPIQGGDVMSISIDLSGIDEKYLFLLTVAFQAKLVSSDNNDKKKYKIKTIKNNKDKDVSSISNSKISNEEKSNNLTSILGSYDNIPKEFLTKDNLDSNPLDYNVNNANPEKGDIYTTLGTYKHGIITCKIPRIVSFNQLMNEYNVDVSLNGLQYSEYPLIYRFYGN